MHSKDPVQLDDLTKLGAPEHFYRDGENVVSAGGDSSSF